jgi:hypothetical protein
MFAVAAVFSLTSVAGATTSPLTPELLTRSQLPAHFSLAQLTPSDNSTCLKSSFRLRPAGPSVRVAFTDVSVSRTLVIEKLTASSQPSAAFASAVRIATTCRAKSPSLGGYLVSQSIHQVNIGSFSVPAKTFKVVVATGTVIVTAYLLYAMSGHTRMTIGEASASALGVRGFRTLVTRALARIGQ